ncbi:two-component system sensor histidine kinase NtrB [Desulfogranum japonicum]|uniref:two-component system sensor histidine kinase NtrB n=1 Tax=Desulfogranum japonicum TaxID=231447 RepID=UPI000402C7FD|nr:ATP-binding protein [Desulfogranum japonicum]
MIQYVNDKALTIIRSLEAGSRAGYRRNQNSSSILVSLLNEYQGDEDITFIRISDDKGNILAQIGTLTDGITQNTDDKLPLHILPPSKASNQIIITRPFHPRPFAGHHHRMLGRGMGMGMHAQQNQATQELTIELGLQTDKYLQTIRQGIYHSLFMGAILFLLGCAGLYFVYLYQSMQSTKKSLNAMHVYTNHLVESMPAGLMTVDNDNTILFMNRNAEQITGVQYKDLTNKCITDPSLGNLGDGLQIDSPPFSHSFIFYPAKEGKKPLTLTIQASHLYNSEMLEIGTVYILNDITLIQEMEQQLERSRRMSALGKMAAGIAHEIRNPLGTLRGFAQYFGRHSAPDSNGKEYAELMIQEVDRINHNVSALLQFARQQPPEIKLFNLNNLVKKAILFARQSVPDDSIQFVFQDVPVVHMQGDQNMILQVLLNLLRNATCACNNKGTISIQIQHQENTVVVKIKDNGKGMTREEQLHMFDPFYTTHKSGTGLGLAISHQIIEQHHGRFEVTSTHGHGTTISFILPTTSQEA